MPAITLWLDAGMTVDPLLHVVVKLQDTEDPLCFMKASTLAAHVLEACKLRFKCREGTLQDAIGTEVVEDGTQLAAGTYFFTPAEAVGISRSSGHIKCQKAALQG